MDASLPAAARDRHRMQWWTLAAILLALAVLGASALWIDRGVVLQEQGGLLAARADALEQRVGTVLAASDRAMRGIARRWSARSSAWPTGAEAREDLQLLDDTLPIVQGLALVATDGRVLISTVGEPGRDLSARPDISAARSAPADAPPRWSAPTADEAPRALLHLARPVRDAAGALIGFVTADLDPSYFQPLLDSLEEEPGVRAALVNTQGLPLLRGRHAAEPDAAAGRPEPGRVTVQRAVRMAAPGLDAPPRVRLSRDEGAMLAAWSRLAWAAGALVLLLALAGLFGLRAMQSAERRYAAQLAQTHDRLERIAQTVPGVLCQFELQPDGRARMPFTTRPLEPVFGLSASLEPGSADVMFEYMHPDDVQGMRDAVLASARTLALFAHEWRMRVPGQPERWVEVHSMPMRQPDGGTLWTGYVADVSEKHAARLTRMALEAAERTSRAKSEFLSRASHELRTPLNAVIGFSTLLLGDGRHALADAQRQHVQYILQAGQHLLALINDLLDVSAVEAGRVAATIEDVAVESLVDEVVAGAQEQAVAAGVLLRTQAAPSPLGARADRVRLRQVLLNLVSNALKYNHRGGSVTVRLSAQGADRVRIEVEDTGTGLTTEQQSHLFEPFNRLGAEQRGVAGTGIGLTISKMLVELMGGSIEVSSRAGVGSRFAVLLQRATRVPAEAAPDLPPPVVPTDGRPALQLLYAEDNPMNAELVRQVVALCPGTRLRVAASGAEALAAARQVPPDLVLVDLSLGDMDGFELLDRLRAEPATAAVPCIALTADATPSTLQRATRAGFVDYLTKPLDVAALLRRLEREAAKGAGRA